VAGKLSADLQGFVDGMPFGAQLGLKVEEAKPGYVRAVLAPKPSLMNHRGTYQAGVYFTAAEIVGGLLCGTFFDLRSNFLITRNIEIDFKVASNEPISIEARASAEERETVLSLLAGKRKSDFIVEAIITDSKGACLAHSLNRYYLRLGNPRMRRGNKPSRSPLPQR